MEAKNTIIEIDFSYLDGYPTTLPRERVVELAQLPSGRIIVMTEQDSYWFESDGKSPKGSYLTPMTLVRERLKSQAKMTWDKAFKAGIKEVVEFVRRIEKSEASAMSWSFRQRWQAILKKWGIQEAK